MKKLTINVNGIEAVCNFGVNYFYKHYFDITKVDLFVSGLEGIQTTKMFEIIPAIYYAGYMAECSMDKKNVQLKFQDFERYVLSLDEKGAAKLISDYTGLILPEQGEQ